MRMSMLPPQSEIENQKPRISMSVLGSGSSGNCTAVRIGGRLLLIDAGLGPRTVAKRLAGSGMTLHDADALLLTHLDHDHFKPCWFATLRRMGIAVYCHRRHLHRIYRHEPTTREAVDARVLHRHGLLHPFDDEPFNIELLPSFRDAACGVSIRPLPLDHDRDGTVGFRIAAGGSRLGYATDLGRAPVHLIEAMTDLDLLAIESNYDPPTQRASLRPAMLKRRIMGGAGHLSNQQAFDAVRAAVARSRRPPAHVVLLHLSRQCNHPNLARQAFAADPALARRLCISTQTEPTPWLSTAPRQPVHGEQLTMFA